MKEELFNERKSWHMYLLGMGFTVSISLILASLVRIANRSYVGGIDVFFLIVGVLLLLAAFCVFWGTFESRTFYTYGFEDAFALIEKNTGLIIRAQLEKITLGIWPLSTKYLVRRYPTSFGFHVPLNPITSNPKVMSLSLQLKVRLKSQTEIPDWFVGFLDNPDLARQKFRALVFESIRHLPREITDVVNPFNDATFASLKGYLEERLAASLPFYKIDEVRVNMAV